MEYMSHKAASTQQRVSFTFTFSAVSRCFYTKRLRVQPFIHTFKHQWRCQPRGASASPSGAVTPCSHCMRPSTDGGFLTHPCVFPGCITKAISLDSVLAYICITHFDWPTDPSLPEKLNISNFFGRQNRRTQNAFRERPVQSQ